MTAIDLTIPSRIPHNSQIITGFLMLRQQGWDVRIRDCSRDPENPFYGLPVVQAHYRGKGLLYDLWDGYQDPEDMRKGLLWCDYYFKRSFSPEKNLALFPELAGKLYPLGFNYHVTHRRNPIEEPLWKAAAKRLLGRAPDRYFVPEVFEGTPRMNPEEPVKILFLTRLWDQDPALPPHLNQERAQINEMRVQIIRVLRSQYGDNFLGGLNDTPLSRSLSPELILPAKYTERRHYLKLLHSSHICIGTMGLHESIGWKTGEYVAAAKAIVNECLHYTVPGSFLPGKNYLPFSTAQACIQAVNTLVENPQARLAMQQANEAYYRQYLKPDVLVKNTLAIVDSSVDGPSPEGL